MSEACGENLQVQGGREGRAGRICRFKERVGEVRGEFADLRIVWEACGDDLQI